MAEPSVGRFSPERLLLGALLWAEEKDPLPAVADIVRPQDFSEPRCRHAYETVLALSKVPSGGSRRVAFVQTVKNGLEPGDDPWELWVFALDLPEAVPSLARFHATTIRNAAIDRDAKAAYAEAAAREVNLAVPGALADSLSSVEATIQSLATRGADNLLAASNPGEGITHEIVSRGGTTSIELDLMDLDALLGRIESTDVIVVAARPSRGKTALALQMALNVARAHKPVLVFSLEMGSVALAHRWMANLSGVPLGRIRRGQLIGDDRDRLEDAENELKSLQLSVYEADAPTPEAIRAAVERYSLRRHPALVVVDYLQLLSAPGESNRVAEVSKISRDLKRMARETNTPLILLSQLSRGAQDGERPRLAHLRDSGAIEQDADAVLMLWAESEANVMHVAVEKNRNGATGTCRLYFDPTLQRIRSLEPKSEFIQ